MVLAKVKALTYRLIHWLFQWGFPSCNHPYMSTTICFWASGDPMIHPSLSRTTPVLNVIGSHWFYTNSNGTYRWIEIQKKDIL